MHNLEAFYYHLFISVHGTEMVSVTLKHSNSFKSHWLCLSIVLKQSNPALNEECALYVLTVTVMLPVSTHKWRLENDNEDHFFQKYRKTTI